MMTMMMGMSCREMTELVTEYAEGSLSWYDWMRFQWHLGLCVNCRAYVSQMKTTIETMGKLEPEDVPEEARTALIEQFKGWKTHPEPVDAVEIPDA